MNRTFNLALPINGQTIAEIGAILFDPTPSVRWRVVSADPVGSAYSRQTPIPDGTTDFSAAGLGNVINAALAANPASGNPVPRRPMGAPRLAPSPAKPAPTAAPAAAPQSTPAMA